jgi:hypothetical protein
MRQLIVLLIISTICLVHIVQCDLTATANLHADSGTLPVGTLVFYQSDSNSPVRIVGFLNGLKNYTIHVTMSSY